MGRLVQSLTRVELWMVIGLIALMVVVFFRSFSNTLNLVDEFKPEQMKSALQASLREVHITWLARGRPTGLEDELEVGQEPLQMNDQGWPIGVGRDLLTTEVSDRSCEDVFQALLTDYVAGQLPSQDVDLQPHDGAIVAKKMELRSLAVGTVCVYQIGFGQQTGYSLLYNTASGEVRGAAAGSAWR